MNGKRNKKMYTRRWIMLWFDVIVYCALRCMVAHKFFPLDTNKVHILFSSNVSTILHLVLYVPGFFPNLLFMRIEDVAVRRQLLSITIIFAIGVWHQCDTSVTRYVLFCFDHHQFYTIIFYLFNHQWLLLSL